MQIRFLVRKDKLLPDRVIRWLGVYLLWKKSGLPRSEDFVEKCITYGMYAFGYACMWYARIVMFFVAKFGDPDDFLENI